MSEDSRVPSHSSPGARWQPPSPDELHAQLRQYEILEILGVGGMGAVYKGFQTSLERYVAIKILPPSVSDEDLHYAERFKQEAKTMARLSHPGIIGVHDCGETADGLLYIVMEYVEGTDVHQMILAQGHLPAEQVLAISMHVCDALSYAHEHGVIHRDIKPANIMVDNQGRVKVADFGLAKMAAVQSGLSTANMTLGTAEYVAPEALTVGVEVDQRADLYSMGVTIYEMLTGKVPRGRFAAASAVVPGLDHRFDDVINRAMQDNRDARYSTAAELRQALMVIHSVPLPNLNRSAPAAARRPAPMPRPRATPVAAPAKSGFPYALVAGLVTVLAVGLFFWKPWASPKEDHPSTESTSATPPPQETKSKEVAATPPTPAPVPKADASSATVAADPAKPAPMTPPTPAVTAAPAPSPEAPPAPVAPPPKSELDQRLDTLEEKFRAAAEAKVEATFKDSVATLNKGYYSAVERALTDATQSGKLDDAVALRDELKRPDKTAILPNDANISTDPNPPPRSLKELRTTYWTTMKRLEADRLKTYAPLFDRYDEALAQIQTELTKAGKIDDAVRLKELREALVDRRTAPSAYASSSASGTNLVVPSEEINLFDNGSFEKGTVSWTLNSNKGAGQMAMDTKENYHGRPALRIDNAQPDDTHVWQKVAVKPHTRYKIAGWIKTSELGVLSEKTKPESCLAVEGGYIKTQQVRSGQDWTRVAKEFETKDETEIKVGARLGFYSDLTSGTAWFAGLSLTEVAPQVSGAPSTPGSATAPTAVSAAGFTNALGMKFVGVPGTRIVMCIHETRRKDYAAYAAATPNVNEGWKNAHHKDGQPVGDKDDDPVVSVNWEDAVAFCQWLTKKDGHLCRLPTDHEWSMAVGIGQRESPNLPPDQLNQKIGNEYPWGKQWPPPKGAGNLGIEGYDDGYEKTAPVMSFTPNKSGIYDLAGNVWEWCDDWSNAEHKERVMRGGSWADNNQANFLSSRRAHYNQGARPTFVGFRCVIALNP